MIEHCMLGGRMSCLHRIEINKSQQYCRFGYWRNTVWMKVLMKGELLLMHYYYSPKVKLLLMNESTEKETMLYADSLKLKVPKIGPRPPYYCHPRYGFYFPVI